MLSFAERFGCQPGSALRSRMDARPVAIAGRVNPSESIHSKTQTHLTRLESHPYTISQRKSFRITFLRKNRGGGGHSVNQLPKTVTAPVHRQFPEWSFSSPCTSVLSAPLRYLLSFDIQLSTSTSSPANSAPNSFSALFANSAVNLFASFPSLSYTHSLSLQPRSCKC
jgi:hypothetical protein